MKLMRLMKLMKLMKQLMVKVRTNDEGGFDQMLKDFAWSAFEFTGNIDSYFFFKEIEEKNRSAERKNPADTNAIKDK